MSKKPVNEYAAQMRRHDIETFCGEIIALAAKISGHAASLRKDVNAEKMEANFARMIQAGAETLLRVSNELNETV